MSKLNVNGNRLLCVHEVPETEIVPCILLRYTTTDGNGIASSPRERPVH